MPPYDPITPIPNTGLVAATASTWNTRFAEVDLIVADIDSRLSALEGRDYEEISASRAQLPTDRVIFADATAGMVNVTLLPPDGADAKEIVIAKVDATANAVRVSAPVGKTVMGAAYYDMIAADAYVRLMPHGTNYRRIG